MLRESGAVCVTQEDRVRTVEVEPEVSCRHSQQERCHLTYLTYFTPSRQQVCKAGILATALWGP